MLSSIILNKINNNKYIFLFNFSMYIYLINKFEFDFHNHLFKIIKKSNK